MSDLTVRRSFVALHLTLGLVVAFESMGSLVHALGALGEHQHMALRGSVEFVAALLFLWPRTMRIGGSILVAIFLLTALVQIVQVQFPASPLVYAAAALFATLHGSAWQRLRSAADALPVPSESDS